MSPAESSKLPRFPWEGAGGRGAPLRVLLLASAVLTACGSTPARFYTLVAPPAAEPARAAAAFAFELLPVGIPAQVNVPQLVVRQSAGELVPVDTRQWIAPLSAEIRDALSAQIAARLGARDVHRVTVPAGTKVYRVQVDVRRFESALGRSARLETVWSLRSRVEDRALNCASDFTMSVGPGYEALVQGHQQAVARLAAQIAAGLEATERGQPQCPAADG